ncbi:MAG: hypothetical protein J5477_03850 [Schwartzia sp.]|nr:hypothetical protein [Schwartzia sp. (in: firmicutes)]MBR5162571.1 hypothetical protein [Schwartzia sp. (in: firmicutes)]
MADKKQNPVKYGEVIAKCWEDEMYKKRFIEDPESVLTEAGFVCEEGVTYKVIEQPKLVKYLVLPHEGTRDSVQTIAKKLLNEAEQKDVIIPEGAEVRIIQNTEDTRFLVLPASPKTLTKNELALAAGGNSAAVAANVVEGTNVTLVTVGEVVTVSDVTVTTTPEITVMPGVVATTVVVLI